MTPPILYTFRRCPYAMRARLAISRAGTQVELRENLLRDKAPEFLETSPKGTVPVLLLDDGTVIEQSLEVMQWAWPGSIPLEELELVERMDAEFKPMLDRYKYPTRFEDGDADTAFAKASEFVSELEKILTTSKFLSGTERGFADLGIAPFIRQFAHVDLDRFKSQDWPKIIQWYQEFVDWEGFQNVMAKYPKWVTGDPVTFFPTQEN